MRYVVAILTMFFLTIPYVSFAQTDPSQIQQEYLEEARITSVSASQRDIIQGLGTSIRSQIQQVTAEVLTGHDKGIITSFKNESPTQVTAGQLVYVRHTSGGDAPDAWSISDPYRIPVLVGLAVLFFVLVLMFGGLPGVRGIASLAGSLVLIFYVMIPGIYAGLSPILMSIGVASLIIIVGSYITHGFNRTTSVAVIGMIATVLVTGAAGYYFIHAASLTGFTTENNAYLNFNTAGKIDMVGLLFGGIMIGLLGVLYDIAIGQAVAVEELFRASTHYSRNKVYRRGLRIGREHIGALVNTLAIAYVGASLPLLLLFKDSTAGALYVINSEQFATEIIRILIGSIGLVLAVPITTFIASYMLQKHQNGTDNSENHQHHH